MHEEPVICGTRHGEGPCRSGESKGKLQAGMVFTIEPAVYMPGRLGIRIEDDILVTENGYKILSGSCPHVAFGAV